METDSAVRQIPGESAAGVGGGGREEGTLSQDARAAADARARGKKRASNVDDAEPDTDEANTPIKEAIARARARVARRMASMLDGTMSAETYGAPKEMRAYQGALRPEGATEPAGASDNWAQEGLTEAELAYNERRALARAKARADYVPPKDRDYAEYALNTRSNKASAIEWYSMLEEKQAEIEAKPFQQGELASERAREEYAATERAMAHCVAKKGEEPELMYWAEVEPPGLFDLTYAHREEIELITLEDLQVGCSLRLSCLSAAKGQTMGSFAPLFILVTENDEGKLGLKVALRSYSQVCAFIDYNKSKMVIVTPEHVDICSMQLRYHVQRCNKPSPLELGIYKEESKRATVRIRSMYFCAGGK